MRWLWRWLGHKPSAFDFATGTEVCARCGTVLDASAGNSEWRCPAATNVAHLRRDEPSPSR